MSEEGKAVRESRADPDLRGLLDRAQTLESEERFQEAADLLVARLPPGSGELPEGSLPLARRAAVLLERLADLATTRHRMLVELTPSKFV